MKFKKAASVVLSTSLIMGTSIPANAKPEENFSSFKQNFKKGMKIAIIGTEVTSSIVMGTGIVALGIALKKNSDNSKKSEAQLRGELVRKTKDFEKKSAEQDQKIRNLHALLSENDRKFEGKTAEIEQMVDRLFSKQNEKFDNELKNVNDLLDEKEEEIEEIRKIQKEDKETFEKEFKEKSEKIKFIDKRLSEIDEKINNIYESINDQDKKLEGTSEELKGIINEQIGKIEKIKLLVNENLNKNDKSTQEINERINKQNEKLNEIKDLVDSQDKKIENKTQKIKDEIKGINATLDEQSKQIQAQEEHKEKLETEFVEALNEVGKIAYEDVAKPTVEIKGRLDSHEINLKILDKKQKELETKIDDANQKYQILSYKYKV